MQPLDRLSNLIHVLLLLGLQTLNHLPDLIHILLLCLLRHNQLLNLILLRLLLLSKRTLNLLNNVIHHCFSNRLRGTNCSPCTLHCLTQLRNLRLLLLLSLHHLLHHRCKLLQPIDTPTAVILLLRLHDWKLTNKDKPKQCKQHHKGPKPNWNLAQSYERRWMKPNRATWSSTFNCLLNNWLSSTESSWRSASLQESRINTLSM